MVMFAGDDGTDGHHGLTDYELERVAHIRRNREIMRQLGLGFHDIVTAARARCGEEDGPSEPSEKRRKTDVRLTKTPRATETVEAGIERVLRRSRRLMENTDERRENTDDYPNAAIEKRSKYLADHEIDEVHERDAAASSASPSFPSRNSTRAKRRIFTTACFPFARSMALIRLASAGCDIVRARRPAAHCAYAYGRVRSSLQRRR